MSFVRFQATRNWIKIWWKKNNVQLTYICCFFLFVFASLSCTFILLLLLLLSLVDIFDKKYNKIMLKCYRLRLLRTIIHLIMARVYISKRNQRIVHSLKQLNKRKEAKRKKTKRMSVYVMFVTTYTFPTKWNFISFLFFFRIDSESK